MIEGIPIYLTLVERLQGRKMKATISLKRDRIKLIENGKKIIIPLDPKEGKLWIEPWEEETHAKKLYQVIQGDRDSVEPNIRGELLHDSTHSVSQNLDMELDEWKLENYESKARECWSIEAIPKDKFRSCFSIKTVQTI